MNGDGNSIFSDLLMDFLEKQTEVPNFSINKTKPPPVVTTRVCFFCLCKFTC